MDALIFGGGAAGLWLLDELHRRGTGALLVERCALGFGQTIASQGIIHGGIKYCLSGSLTPSAKAIREMPALWRACLQGGRQPDLSRTRLASPCCYLWRSESVTSRLGLIGARIGLRTGTAKVAVGDRPAALARCPGEVFRVEEQVIDVPSLIRDLADRHADRLVKVASARNVSFDLSGSGRVDSVSIQPDEGTERIRLKPVRVVFTAGAGNEALRTAVDLSGNVMQRRALHMVLVRGDLPILFGHCVDGAKTRVTITTVTDSAGRTVWQVGGQVSEDGVEMDETELIRMARHELADVLPGVDLRRTQWSTYRIDRAESKTAGGSRAAGPVILQEGNVLTAWPSKLALVPQLAAMMVDRLPPPRQRQGSTMKLPVSWPSPQVAQPPWERAESWHE